jgi:putative ABC transport system substrate-binding protein
MRRVGVLIPGEADDPDFQARVGALLQGLQQLGWAIGRNVQVDVRWATANPLKIRRYATELAAGAPDVIVAHGASSVGPLLQATRSVPIVFPVASDPVAAGFVASLARPGGNETGFMANDYTLSGKWLDLLKQIAPNVTKVAVLRDSTTPTGPATFAVIQALAPSLGVEVVAVDVQSSSQLERTISTFAQVANGGLVVSGSSAASQNRKLIALLAARYKLPAIYPQRNFVTSGGLIAYGADYVEQYRQAADYVSRILHGEKAGELPVQAPIKYNLVINLTTAKALGLIVPPTLLARADEVIE